MRGLVSALAYLECSVATSARASRVALCSLAMAELGWLSDYVLGVLKSPTWMVPTSSCGFAVLGGSSYPLVLQT